MFRVLAFGFQNTFRYYNYVKIHLLFSFEGNSSDEISSEPEILSEISLRIESKSKLPSCFLTSVNHHVKVKATCK